MRIFPARRAVAASALAVPLLLTGCGGSPGGGGDGPADGVVASFYPLQYVTQRVAGDLAEVHMLTAPGVDPHDLELTVRQAAELSDADLVIYARGLQPAVDEAVRQHASGEVVEVTHVIELRPMDAEAHEGESEAEHEAHGDVEGDPHFWLDPELMARVADDVAARMSDLDPDNAAVYAENLTSLRTDLEDLDADYRAGLAQCRLDTVVVSHDAFAYLEKYGLHFEPIAGLSPDAEPSPAHLRKLADLIREEGVTTVFSETLASPAMAETLARELDLETAVLDPVEGLTEQTAGEDYLSLMRANLSALQEANRCR